LLLSHLSPSSALPSRFPPSSLFFFNAPATPALYPLSLHDALPISSVLAYAHTTHFHTRVGAELAQHLRARFPGAPQNVLAHFTRSEEHTSELQSLTNLVCRLLLEKKKTQAQSLICRSPCLPSHPHT